MCADLGSLQRLPLIGVNDSFLREMAYTGRNINSKEALEFGLVSKIFENRESMIEGLIALATVISEKSPIAIYTIKNVLNSAKSSKISKGLNVVGLYNQSMLFTSDLFEAVKANLTKTKPKFPKI